MAKLGKFSVIPPVEMRRLQGSTLGRSGPHYHSSWCSWGFGSSPTIFCAPLLYEESFLLLGFSLFLVSTLTNLSDEQLTMTVVTDCIRLQALHLLCKGFFFKLLPLSLGVCWRHWSAVKLLCMEWRVQELNWSHQSVLLVILTGWFFWLSLGRANVTQESALVLGWCDSLNVCLN